MMRSLLQVDNGVTAKSQVENIRVYFAVTVNTDSGSHRSQDVPVLCMQHVFLPDTSSAIAEISLSAYPTSFVVHYLKMEGGTEI